MTIQLLFFGFIAGILLGLAIGLVTFSYRGTRVEKVILSINGIMMAIPDYLWAIILIVIFGVGLQWLPFLGPVGANISIEHITGFLTLDSLLTGNWEGLGSSLAHLVLPSLTLALVIATPIARMAYSSLTEVYREDYIHAARLRGVSSKRILMFHALRRGTVSSETAARTISSPQRWSLLRRQWWRFGWLTVLRFVLSITQTGTRRFCFPTFNRRAFFAVGLILDMNSPQYLSRPG